MSQATRSTRGLPDNAMYPRCSPATAGGGRQRSSRGMLAGVVALAFATGGFLAQPAAADVSTDPLHLWNVHLLPQAKKSFYTKTQVKTLLSRYQKRYSHVVVVAKSGGEYTSPVAALAAIAGDCETDQRYLLFIAPGAYDLGAQSLNMKECVDVRGAGRDATVLRSQAAPGTVALANSATLSDLTVENNGANAEQAGIYSAGVDASARVENVVARSTNGTSNCGIFNSGSSPTISNVVAEGSGGQGAWGICNVSASPNISHATARGSGAYQGGGIANSYGAPVIADSTCKGTGTNSSYGIYTGYSDVTIVNSTVEAGGGSNSNDGIYLGIYDSGATPVIRGCTVTVTGTGTSWNIGIDSQANSGGATIADSTVTASGGFNAYGMYCTIDGAIVNGTIVQASGATNNYAFHNGSTDRAFLTSTTLIGTVAIDNPNAAAGSVMMSGGRISGTATTDGRNLCSGVIKGSNAWAGAACN